MRGRLSIRSRTSIALAALIPLLIAVISAEPLTSIPNPRSRDGTWVTDMPGMLRAETVARLNSTIGDLERTTGTEMAVVVIRSLDGLSVEEAAAKLFDLWGIGKKKQDNGLLLLCAQSEQLEGIHPMQGGILRRKVRTDRRPALGLEARWSFYPKYVIGLLRKTVALGQQAYFLKTVRKRIESDPLAKHYTDVALTPVQDDEFDELELVTHTADAKAAVYQTRKIESRHAAAD